MGRASRGQPGWIGLRFIAIALIALAGTALGPVIPASAADSTAGQPAVGSVESSPDPIPDQYIVTLRDPNPNAVAPTVVGLTNRHGGSVTKVYASSLQGYAVDASPTQAAQLAADPAVAAVEQDGYVHATTTQSLNESATPPDSWGLDRIDQHNLPLDNSYQYAQDGSGVHAYIIDSGINTALADFGGRASVGTDILNDGDGPACTDGSGDPSIAGHGTHVAGIVGGTRYGVAKQVSLVSVRVLDCTGTGTKSNIIAGVNWVTANAIKPAVANISIGGTTSSALDDAITASIASGVTYAVSAGNGTTNACTQSPADTPNAITVGATTITDGIATYSNYGPCVDLFAPGTNITSDWNVSTGAAAGFTNLLSGTSMATPHVTGAAALLLSQNPSATPATVASLLTSNATAGDITGLKASPASPNLLVDSFPTVVAPVAPSAPTLNAPTVGSGVVHLSWTVPANGGSPITGYQIYRGPSAGGEGGTAIAAAGASATTFDDTSVTNGTTYYYEVTASNAIGEGADSNERSAQPAASPPPPSGSIDVFGRASTNSLNWQRVAGATTPPITNLGGSVSSNPAAASDSSGTAVFVRGADGALWLQRIVGGSPSGWVSLGGYLTSDPVAVATGSEVDVFVRGGDNAIYWERINGTVAAGVATGYTSLGGWATSNPSAVVVSGAKLVFVLSSGGGVFVQRITTGPSSWQSLGGAATSDPIATTDAFNGGGATVFVRGTDQSEFRQHVSATGAGSGWLGLGGNVISNAGVASDGVNTYVFVLGVGGGVFSQQLTSATGSGPGWTSLGGYGTSDPKGVFDGTNVRVVIKGGDNGMYWRTLASGWTAIGGNDNSNPVAVAAS